MRQYLARRVLLFVPTLFVVSLLIFFILRVIPGDVAMYILMSSEDSSADLQSVAALREELGLNAPLHLQYAEWIGGIARLDFGQSLLTKENVSSYLSARLPVTLQLALMTTVFAILIGTPLGVLSAIRQNSVLDYVMRLFSITGIAIPNFWLGTLLILGLVTAFRWVPPIGFPTLFEDPAKNLQIMFWPALVLGYHTAAYLLRMTRSCMLEVLRQDYVRTAWAKGLAERAVVLRHALRNALIPVVTLLGLQLAAVLGGSVVVESIFVLPGVGLTLIDAVSTRDYPLVQALIVLFAVFTLVINLLVDVVYGWLDPRIRYG